MRIVWLVMEVEGTTKDDGRGVSTQFHGVFEKREDAEKLALERTDEVKNRWLGIAPMALNMPAPDGPYQWIGFSYPAFPDYVWPDKYKELPELRPEEDG